MNFADFLVKEEREKDAMDKKEKEERAFLYQSMSFIDRCRYDHIHSIISDLAYKIQKESGWEYDSHGFRFPSDFHMENGVIEYHMNRVMNNGSGYMLQESMNDRELMFMDKYGKILKRLSVLEKQRDHLLSKAKGQMGHVVLVDFEPTRKKNLDHLFARSWLQAEARQFLQKYHGRGVDTLVSTLNMIADGEDNDSSYDEVMKLKLSSDYKKDVLRWASAFCKRGNILYERYNDHRQKIIEYDSFPSSFMHDESDLIMYYKNKH